jgi:catechol 2,3-dioxygenase-like lactoylglutathione lyase family enzyme
MNGIESLQASVIQAVPTAQARLRRPRNPEGSWWLDFKVDQHLVTVEWSPRRGYGISASVLGDGYGEGPEETYPGEAEATARIIELLQHRAFTSPPTAVALQELRLLLGHTQQDVAAAMGIGQAAVSRLEHREDLTIGSLKRYLDALGVELDIRVKTPDGNHLSLDIVSAGPGSGKGVAAACCQHREHPVNGREDALVEPHDESVNSWLTLCLSRLHALLSDRWQMPTVRLVVSHDLKETASCDVATATIHVNPGRVRMIAANLMDTGQYSSIPSDSQRLVLHVFQHLLAHELGHLASQEADELFPAWITDNCELRADAMAGWLGARAGADPTAGATLSRALGCSVPGCTHPLSGERAAAYLVGHLAGLPSPFSSPGLSLLVIRSANIDRARSFYGLLGLDFVEERHGQGPRHHAARLPGGTVFEIYPCIAAGHSPGGVRVGLETADPVACVERLTEAGLLPAHATRRGDGTVIVVDPDGNRVELTPPAEKPKKNRERLFAAKTDETIHLLTFRTDLRINERERSTPQQCSPPGFLRFPVCKICRGRISPCWRGRFFRWVEARNEGKNTDKLRVFVRFSPHRGVLAPLAELLWALARQQQRLVVEAHVVVDRRGASFLERELLRPGVFTPRLRQRRRKDLPGEGVLAARSRTSAALFHASRRSPGRGNRRLVRHSASGQRAGCESLAVRAAGSADRSRSGRV